MTSHSSHEKHVRSEIAENGQYIYAAILQEFPPGRSLFTGFPLWLTQITLLRWIMNKDPTFKLLQSFLQFCFVFNPKNNNIVSTYRCCMGHV